MATKITLIRMEINGSMRYKSLCIPSKVETKSPKYTKIWYYIERRGLLLYFTGAYVATASYDKQKKQIFNNIPIKRIEKKLVASRAALDLSMEEIKQFVNELREITNRKEE